MVNWEKRGIPLKLLILLRALMLPPLVAEAAPARPQNLLPSQQAGGNKAAIAMVKQRYPGVRVLSVNAVERKGRRAWRVKTLTAEGVVRTVVVDPSRGVIRE